MNIDKSKWKKAKFGNIAIQQKDCVDIETTELNRYIAGEHMDTEDIHLRKWGIVGDGYLGPAFIRKFEKGDILYGSRRTYLKKVALADFDGITANTTFVIKANREMINPVLLPFLMLSDSFTKHSVGNSKGSVNPYINWKDIADYEFLLPPKSEQTRLAELLWAADEVVEREKEVKTRLENIYKSFVFNVMNGDYCSEKKKLISMYSPHQTKEIQKNVPYDWDIYRLSDVIIETQSGFAEGKRDENGIVQLRMNNVTKNCRLDKTEIIKVPINKIAQQYFIAQHDVLFNNTNSPELVGKCVIFENIEEPIVFSNHFTKLIPNTNILSNRFLYLWFVYNFSIGLFERRCTKWVGQAAVQAENLMSLRILVPSLKNQKSIEEVTRNIEHNIDLIDSQIKQSIKLKSLLINQIF